MKVATTVIVYAFVACLRLQDVAAALKNKRPKPMVRGGEHRNEEDGIGAYPGESSSTGGGDDGSRSLAFSNSTSSGGSSSNQQGIVGGTVVTSAIPWFAEGWGCGASLVWKDFLVTAAHCWDKQYIYDAFSPGDTVYIGHTTTRTLTPGAEAKKIKKVFIHPGHSLVTNVNDVMMVQLTSTVSSTRPFVQLNDNRTVPAAGGAVTAYGYGTLRYNGPTPSQLHVVTVNAVGDTKCKQQYRNYATVYPNMMMCAAASGKDTCNGDSGGPLVIASTNVLVGITSWGNECALPGYPGIYTRVSTYKSWIESILCQYSSVKPSFC